jgi:hypothetical protein
MKSLLFFILLLTANQVFGFEPEMLSLTPGRTQNELGISWLSQSDNSSDAGIKFAPSRQMNNGQFPQNAIMVRTTNTEAYSGWISHKANLTNLLPDTEYTYAASNDGQTYSQLYTYRTPSTADFTFVAIGDAHITDKSVSSIDYLDKNRDKTTLDAWSSTLNIISREVPNLAFIAAMGDQVDRNLTAGSPEGNPDEHRRKYVNLFSPDIFRTIPFSPAMGNHEARSNKSSRFHYNLPNEVIIKGDSMVITNEAAGRAEPMRENENRFHYYYIYNNVLFVVLNSSPRVSNIEQAQRMISIFGDVLQKATADYAQKYDWLFVHHHKTTIGVADHAADTDIQYYVEAGIERLFADHKVDVVFAGHDHSYARSFPLQADTGTGSINGVKFDRSNNGNTINQGEGTVFFTLNSPTGQKFYEEFVPDVKTNPDFPYLYDGSRGSEALMSKKLHWGINVFRQEYKPMFIKVGVSANSLIISTHEIDQNTATMIDKLTVNKR